MRRFLQTYGSILSLTFIIWFFLFSCTDEASEVVATTTFEEPVGLYLVDTSAENSLLLAKEIEMAFQYAKIPFSQVSTSEFNANPDFYPLTRVVYLNNTLALDSLSKVRLLRFVSEGGALVLTSLNEDPSMGFLSGLKSYPSYEFHSNQKGVKFLKDVLPGMAGRTGLINSEIAGLKRENFIDDIEILVSTAQDENTPVIFQHQIGNGRVVHVNTFRSIEKQDRGLFFALALPALQGFPYSIANLATIMIDDFPNPLYEITAEPIASEMGINSAEFVTDVWWPDMLRISERFNIPYTVYPCFNYDLIKEPPFIFREWELHKSMRDGRQRITTNWLVDQVRSNDFELAFHGYNHEHLTQDLWPNVEYIEGALEATMKKWTVNAFGAYPVSYVPPSNYIDSVGLHHLANAMPELEFMASTYDGEFDEGGGREFGLDPLEPRLFDFPRVSSGYIKSDAVHSSIHSLYLYTGIWTHFIHPDDVYQIPAEDISTAGDFRLRNQNRLNWYRETETKPSMFGEWVDFLMDMKRTLPSMQFMKVSNAGRLTKAWRSAKVDREQTGDLFSVTMESKTPWPTLKYYWNVYVESANELRLESTLIDQRLSYTKTGIMNGSLYTIETDQPELRFPETTRVLSAPPFYKPEVFDMVFAQYSTFEKQKEINAVLNEQVTYFDEEGNLAIEDSVAYYVANDELGMATAILEKRLRSKSEIDAEQFEYFSLYLAYDERSDDLWGFLEDIYQNESRSLAFDYLNLYLEKESYPNERLNELWVRRQLLDDPSNKQLLDEYLLYFYNIDNKEQVKTIVEHYHEVVQTADSYQLYIQYLLDFEPELIPEELKDKDPEDHPNLQPYATTFSYLYSDIGDVPMALTWAEYSEEIDIMTILQWWIDLEAYNKMEQVYLEYISKHPRDEQVKAFVSNFWFDIGEVERSALVAKQFERDTTRSKIQGRFDTEVRYFEPDVQKFLMIRAPGAMSPDTLEMIKARQRISSHDYISYQTDFVIDNFNQSVWNNSMSYHLRSKNLYVHTISATYSDISDIQLNAPDVNNVPHSLYGLRYRFETPIVGDKPVFYGLAGLEQDDSGTFLSIGGGFSKSDSIKFFSLGYTLSPVRTGPAISQSIYWGELTGYYERGANKKWQTILSPVLTHYGFDSGVYEAAMTAQISYKFSPKAKSTFSPYLEGFGSMANANIADGNPFWVVSERAYAGGGLAWIRGNQEPGQLYLRAEAGAFYDTYTGPFVRFTGLAAFPIKKYLHVNAQFEYFNQDLYFSNGFRIGVNYFLNRRKPYTYRRRSYDDLYE